jgi:hypothetical protein
MKGINNIEKVFKEKLGSYEEIPPEGVWSKISSQLPSPVPFTHWYLRKTFYRYAASILLIAAIPATYLLINYKNNSLNQINQIPYKKSETIRENRIPVEKDNTFIKVGKQIISEKVSPIIVPNSITISAADRNSQSEPLNSEIQDKPLAVSESLAEINKHVMTSEILPAIEISAISEKLIQELPDAIALQEGEKDKKVMISDKVNEIIIEYPTAQKISDTLIQQILTNINPIPIKRNYPYSIALLGGTDRMYNTSTSFKRNLASDLRFSYKTRDFFIQSGLGIDYSNDKWYYSYDLRQKEILGTYQRVDSMYLTQHTDTLGHIYFTPNFVTSEQPVYDSVNHYTEKSASDYYIYLHVPIIAGYNIFRNKRFEVNLKAGPVFSFLIDEKKGNPDEPFYDARILTVSNNRLNRLSTQWYMIAACEFGYSITNKFSFIIEPTIRYFKEPFYNSPGMQKSPWSAGMRFGLNYSIGKNQ